ncbi:MoaD/ThiS family protein [Desulfitibacter alkalitolerans]|uniref:MoaD/ThiS family protein n=1 Tax=Desulfitibacter alkalitolerans TaxID=264641 RepID=UPI0004871FEA|nr:MoaD/ThiS family protein [Desulfitibacter alkalitolerans]
MNKANIKIKFFAMAANEIGVKELELQVEKDLTESLKQIEEKINWPLRTNLENNRFALMLNGRTLKTPIENKQLADGDVLALIPIMGGG